MLFLLCMLSIIGGILTLSVPRNKDNLQRPNLGTLGLERHHLEEWYDRLKWSALDFFLANLYTMYRVPWFSIFFPFMLCPSRFCKATIEKRRDTFHFQKRRSLGWKSFILLKAKALHLIFVLKDWQMHNYCWWDIRITTASWNILMLGYFVLSWIHLFCKILATLCQN